MYSQRDFANGTSINGAPTLLSHQRQGIVDIWKIKSKAAEHYREGRLAEALQGYTEFIAAAEAEQRPIDSDTSMRRGIVYYLLNQPAEALDDLTACLEPNAPAPGGHYYRGLVYLGAQRYPEADADHRRFIDLTTQAITEKIDKLMDNRKRARLKSVPVSPDYIRLPIATGLKASYERAIQDCSAALSAGQNRDTALFCRAAAYEQQREFFKALDDYRAIHDPALANGVAFSVQRCEQAALYVRPSDKQLIQPNTEYCVESNGVYEFFDSDHYKKRSFVLSMNGWQLVASTFHQEGHEKYYQRQR
jgi:tetratricopeptide (TPR) repeat protein